MVEAAKVFENVAAKKKKIRLGKNRKKSWRKHIDLSDIDFSMDKQKQEKQYGWVIRSLLEMSDVIMILYY